MLSSNMKLNFTVQGSGSRRFLMLANGLYSTVKWIRNAVNYL